MMGAILTAAKVARVVRVIRTERLSCLEVISRMGQILLRSGHHVHHKCASQHGGQLLKLIQHSDMVDQ